MAGKLRSHSCRSGTLRQFAMSCSGRTIYDSRHRRHTLVKFAPGFEIEQVRHCGLITATQKLATFLGLVLIKGAPFMNLSHPLQRVVGFGAEIELWKGGCPFFLLLVLPARFRFRSSGKGFFVRSMLPSSDFRMVSESALMCGSRSLASSAPSRCPARMASTMARPVTPVMSLMT